MSADASNSSDYDDFGSGFDAAPAELHPGENQRSEVAPIRNPEIVAGTHYDEKTFVLDLSVGTGKSRGHISTHYAGAIFSPSLLNGKVYRLRLHVVSDRKRDSAVMVYFGLTRLISEENAGYEVGSLKASMTLNYYQVGYRHLWKRRDLQRFIAGAEVDMGVTLEDFELNSPHGSINQSRLRPNVGAGLVVMYIPLESLELSLTLRASAHIDTSFLAGVGYVF